MRHLYAWNADGRDSITLSQSAPFHAGIREGLAGNLCRCTGFTRIFESVVSAASADTSNLQAQADHAR